MYYVEDSRMQIQAFIVLLMKFENFVSENHYKLYFRMDRQQTLKDLFSSQTNPTFLYMKLESQISYMLRA